MNRPISLNPSAEELEVVRIIYPNRGLKGRNQWRIEPMRFVPHDGKACA